jgi:peptidoglycan/LPS O-acetylase OafA/YrhL
LTAATAPESAAGGTFRPDIEGLRAVAVLLIVLYHAGVGVLGGGYVGVDVFFVISGFLITGLLLRELDDTHRLNLVEFYARRARRILPAAFLVLGAIIVGYLVLLSPVALWRAAPDIAAAAAYVPNFRFAFEHSDYFHPARVSPVIHYWSLGVEEQFYAVWPAFLWLGYRVVHGSRTALTRLVVIVVATSFLLSLVGTAVYPTATFYLLPTRAWELGVGALLALGAPAGKLGTRLAIGAGMAGLALIALSAVAFRESTPFPGLAGVLPVGGAALVIAAGSRGTHTPTAAALSWAPMRWVGRISYSLYLWHWPVGIFAAAVLATAPAPVQAALGVAASTVLAAGTYRWIEDPLRRGRLIGRRPAWNLAGALAMSAIIAAGALGAGHLAVAPFRQGRAVPPSTTADPLAGLLPPAGPTPDGPLPHPLIPPLLHIHRAAVSVNPNADDRCSLLSGKTVNGRCHFGPPDATKDVVLLGDSHLGQWWPALERIAAERRWRMSVLLKTSCAYEDPPRTTALGPKTECDDWRAGVLRRIATERPDLVVLASNHRPPPAAGGGALSHDAAVAVMAAGAQQTIAAIQRAGSRVVVLADTPRIPFDPAECLSRNARHIRACAVPRAEALDLDWVQAERDAALAAGATFVDVNEWACSSDPCPMVLGRYIVFADTNHLTPAFVQALTSRLDAALPS